MKCKDKCFERGDAAWGHLGYCMCLHFGERKVWWKKYNIRWCEKYNKIITSTKEVDKHRFCCCDF
jgi:hypothetical protein